LECENARFVIQREKHLLKQKSSN
jgi:hypothetical protein